MTSSRISRAPVPFKERAKGDILTSNRSWGDGNELESKAEYEIRASGPIRGLRPRLHSKQGTSIATSPGAY